MHMASFKGTGGCTFDSCFLSLLISSSVCRSRTGISPSESLSRKSNTEVSEELLNPLARAGTLEAMVGAGAGTGTVAATGMFSSSVLENKRLRGGRQATFSRVSFGGLPADEPDCGVDVEAALSSSVRAGSQRNIFTRTFHYYYHIVKLHVYYRTDICYYYYYFFIIIIREFNK